MSVQLRQIFISRVRNELFRTLVTGQLKGWESNVVIGIVDEAMNVNMQNISNYLYEREVMLLNMDEHVNVIINEILLPYLNQKRV